MSEAKPDRSEMWKAIKWVAIAFVGCLIAFGVWKAWSIVTAPARVVEDAAGSVKSSVGNVVNRLDVKLESQKTFNRAAERSFKHLNDLSSTEPDSLKDRAFRLANLKGSENQVCKLSYDFGEGAVPVYLAADNKAHQAAKAVGAKTDRLIRIVIVSPEQTLGLNTEYKPDDKKWGLSWRTSSINKPYEDSWAEKPILEILKRSAKSCN